MRKPWNLPAYPVYSLMTQSQDGITNLNIMTYVIPVSMSPKHYMIALYHGTQSLDNWRCTHRGLLSILAPENMSLVRVLGKKSGRDYNKIRYLNKKGVLSENMTLLGVAGYIELEEVQELPHHGGDHSLYLCKVVTSQSYHEKVLDTTMLVEGGVIL